jgi:diguanylate cyclase (GGDEF)-like protein
MSIKYPPTPSHEDIHTFLTTLQGIGYLWDLTTDTLTWFGAINFYFPNPPATGDEWSQLIHPHDLVARSEALSFNFKGGLLMNCEYRVALSSGDYYWFREIAQGDSLGKDTPSKVMGLLFYDHPQCQYKKELERFSTTDPLTGTFNKSRFCQSLEQSLLYSLQYKISGSYLVVAIDHLDMMNITYGASAVNELICQIAADLKAFVRPTDVVGRISGNTYGVVVEHCDEEEIMTFAQKLSDHIQRKAFPTSAGVIYSTVSIGTVTFPSQGETMADILARADTALAQGKKQGSNALVHYNPHNSQEVSQRHDMKLRGEVHHALVNDQLLLYYQPITDPQKNILLYECLCRLKTQTGEIMSAKDFIPVVERFRMTRLFDIRIMEKVVEALIATPTLRLSLNLSRLTLNDSVWLDRFSGLLRENPSVAPRIVVEITETAALPAWENIEGFVGKIKDLGCSIALDDFGVGYTSFIFLKTLPIDLVKIDTAYVKGIHPDSPNMIFVRALMDMARGLGFKILAEGVESESDFQCMKAEGADLFQGYYLGMPQEKPE